jgi:spore germination cell wall hydrolase CwlJ-like protein
MLDPRKLSELDLLACTLMGEAESEPLLGKIAVAVVIKNRMDAGQERYGLNWREVALKRAQFSCWTDNNALPRMEKHYQARDEIWQVCLAAAEIVYLDQLPGLAVEMGLGEITHYHADYMTPVWAASMIMVKKIGHHEFFREKV